ncbi:MAG TPA: hypothetical protein VNX26_15635 [Candidatus Acidoferrum sp.]|jgi:hypothetical protein|nr:hypothetical protein [Candidatus Acidoferrum sp.]
MRTLTKDLSQGRTNRDPLSHSFRELSLKEMCLKQVYLKSVLLVLLAGTMTLSACGGSSGSSSGGSQVPLTLSGNWQFTMAEQLNSDPTKPSFTGGLQGGFLLQNNGSVAGQASFLIMTQPPAGSGAQPTPCNSGIDQITGTITGQTVNLTAQSSGGQTFTLTGTLAFDYSTMTGSYTSTDGAGCGIATAQNWSATLVPPLTGNIQGLFHSMGGTAGLNQQEFVLSGAILQGANTGASSATVSGNLRFVDPTTFNGDYPCVALASVVGHISGNAVSLQIVGPDGSTIGQIGQTVPAAVSGPQAVTFNSTGTGYVLQSLAGTGYAVYTPACGGGTLQNPADAGSVCIGVNTTTACQPPITLSPSALVFPSQAVGSPASTLTITLANPDSSTLDGITLALTNSNGQGNFTETDNCGVNGAASQGQLFALPGKQFCTVTIGFAPKQGCTAGTSSFQCLTGSLTVSSPTINTILNVLLTGGVTASSASTRGIDFGFREFRKRLLLRGRRTFQDLEHHA